MTVAAPNRRAEAAREERGPLRGPKPEMKFFTTLASTGVLSQNTWQNADQLNNIAAGTGQNQRLGREIRVHRLRMVLNPSDLAGDSLFGVSFSCRLDPTVSGSDIFVSNGSARALLDYPNPMLVNAVYEHKVTSAMTWAGATFGTTPSYAAVAHTVDQSWAKGFRIRYDAAGAVVGPSPIVWFATNETSISCDVGVQVWFTDV